HPDRAAGLGFVGYSVRAFCPVGAALGAIVAGSVADQIVHANTDLADYRYTIAGLVAIAVVLFTAPLLAFTPRLVEVWRRGVRDYGELAGTFARQFEREWFGQRQHGDMLSRADFSAATDLYQVVDRVRDLRLVPVDLTSIVAMAIATLLPFV